MRRNILVQYQGGGYEGCFWEWNFFYISKSGEFFNIFSSGRAGIESLGDAEKTMKEDEPYIYNMGLEEEIKSFATESNVVNITGVLQFFEDHPELEVEFFVLCSGCGAYITDQDDIQLENWHGCGGIESTADKLLCPECYMNGTCDCCCDYVGGVEIVEVKPEEHNDFNYVCVYCKEYHDEQREELEHNDLLWASLATGEPDLFSDDMRWFWGI